MIIDHGYWDYYQPTEQQLAPREVLNAEGLVAYIAYETLPKNIMFARRVSDGMDWYVYQRTAPFGAGSVVMTAQDAGDGTLIIMAATFDYASLFPPRAHLIEETEYTGTAPQDDYGHLIYNKEAAAITTRYVWPTSPTETRLNALEARISKLEAQRR